tara:strand:+ start:251 stop:607 length:357 start_codon:yes stop_codon:yes gene_type:complete
MPLLNQGSKFNISLTAVGTSDTDCYEVPANYSAVVKNLMLTNSSSSTRPYTIKIYQKTPNTTTTITSDHVIASRVEHYIFTADKPLFLSAEDKITIATNATDRIVATVCVEEFYDPAR